MIALMVVGHQRLDDVERWPLSKLDRVYDKLVKWHKRYKGGEDDEG